MNIEPKKIPAMREDAAEIFFTALQAVQPDDAIKRHCKYDGHTLFIGNRGYHLPRFKHVFVVGAGKAGAPMAAAIEDLIGKKVTEGIVTVKYGHGADLSRIKLIEAAHPLPDENGRYGAAAIYNLAEQAGKDDLVLCLISGGGSALMPSPCDGLTLKDKQDTVKALLSCGASIHEINTIRKHISKIKGGQLARAAYPATLVTLILSDVVGDDLDIIASGPTVPDKSSFADCLNIFRRRNLLGSIPKRILKHIELGISGLIPETPQSADPAFSKTHNLIIASNIESLFAAKEKAEALGYHAILLSSMIEGETRYVAQVHAAIAKEIIKTGNPLSRPACILSGGETTVSISGDGLGGRNQEFALSASIDISGNKNIVILSGGTDGTDGPTDAAGAFSDTYTVKRAEKMNLDPYHFLLNNDAYHFFQKLGDLFITGPTQTNVMDLRIVLVD
ncbi:MAG: glycerate kinase [Desulfobacterales bacterium]